MGLANILLTIPGGAANFLLDFTFTPGLGNTLVKLQSSLFLHARKQMSVNVERRSYCGVAQPLLNHFWPNVLFQQ